MSQRIVGMVGDWSNVKTALDIGCGRGILLNAVAMQLKKEGSSGRVVGMDLWLDGQKSMSSTLRTAAIEGVQEYVTCRSGDARNLPFMDNYFDVVVSAVFLHTVGKEFGHKSSAAAAERAKTLQEVVRVLKPGGMAIIWDLVYVPEYVQRLHELKMQEIRVSEFVPAFMVQSHIVSFRKPHHQVQLNGHDWRSSINPRRPHNTTVTALHQNQITTIQIYSPGSWPLSVNCRAAEEPTGVSRLATQTYVLSGIPAYQMPIYHLSEAMRSHASLNGVWSLRSAGGRKTRLTRVSLTRLWVISRLGGRVVQNL